MELLDTEGDEGDDEDLNEEVAEVEKWSEYVEKYINAGPEVSVEIKEMLLKRPVFLTRSAHVLKHKFGVLSATSEASKKESKDTEAATNNPSESKANENEKEAKDVKKSEEREAVTDKPKTEAEPAKDGDEVKTEPLGNEKILDDLIVQENTVVKFQLNSLRPKHGVNSTSLMYRRNSLKLARKVRRASFCPTNH